MSPLSDYKDDTLERPSVVPAEGDLKVLELSVADAPVVKVCVFRSSAEIQRKLDFTVGGENTTNNDGDGSDTILINFNLRIEANYSTRENPIRLEHAALDGPSSVTPVESNAVVTGGSVQIVEVQPYSVDLSMLDVMNLFKGAIQTYESLLASFVERDSVEVELSGLEKTSTTLQDLTRSVVSERGGIVGQLTDLSESNACDLVKSISALSLEVHQKIKSFGQRQAELLRMRTEKTHQCQLISKKLAKLTNGLVDLTHLTSFSDVQDTIRNLSSSLQCVKIVLRRTGIEPGQIGRVQMLLSYCIPSARWEPVYDLKATNGSLNWIELGYFGSVCQWTLENWRNVTLELSTGTPEDGSSDHRQQLKRLTVSYMDKQKSAVPTPGGGRARPYLSRMTTAAAPTQEAELFGVSNYHDADTGLMMTGASNRRFGMATLGAGPSSASVATCMAAAPLAAPLAAPKEAVTADVLSSAANTSFVLRGVEIPGDRNEHRLAIMKRRVPVEVLAFCAPEASNRVFRVGVVWNTTQFILLPSAKLSVYWDGSLISKAQLAESAPPGASFEANLGTSANVKAEFSPIKHVKSASEKSGLAAYVLAAAGTPTATDKETREISGHIANYGTATAETAVVLFRVPISSNETIKVNFKVAVGEHSFDRTNIQNISTNATDLDAVLAAEKARVLSETGGVLSDGLAAAESSVPTAKAPLVLYNETTSNLLCIVPLNPGARLSVTYFCILEYKTGKDVEIH